MILLFWGSWEKGIFSSHARKKTFRTQYKEHYWFIHGLLYRSQFSVCCIAKQHEPKFWLSTIHAQLKIIVAHKKRVSLYYMAQKSLDKGLILFFVFLPNLIFDDILGDKRDQDPEALCLPSNHCYTSFGGVM